MMMMIYDKFKRTKCLKDMPKQPTHTLLVQARNALLLLFYGGKFCGDYYSIHLKKKVERNKYDGYMHIERIKYNLYIHICEKILQNLDKFRS